MIIRKNGVFDALNALDDHRKIGEFPDPRQDVPVSSWRNGTSRNFGYSLSLGVAIHGLLAYKHFDLDDVPD
jgi:hypothetical protein